ncbi:hypothetical protein CFH99_07810 [Nocardioides aromaticivorans]|uniref:Scaffolding protein n=1 Tax=Nocardioides aromaticivorans TaxID=200618 RepID=A0ABX7PI15_9ACTN|nr:hypothetical protein [Nocardioides aromaticivorans]QSR25526.1 hypothetical protein CFH99_07810 [Nocardioides aromaticivorans]
MTDAPVDNPTEPGNEPSAAATTQPEAPKPNETPAPSSSGNPWDDPKAAEAEIKRLRQENGAARTNAKAQAAEEARKELANTIGKALGIVEDGAETDPAKLTESLTKAQRDAKQAQVALAIYQNAANAGGDPVALLDSASFLAKVADLDPSDADALADAIKAAVEANPRLGAAPADPKAPAPNPAQGAAATAGPSIDEQIAEATKAGNHGLAISLKRQKAYAAGN